jgi:hypothetical protein
VLLSATHWQDRVSVWDREVGGSNPLAPTIKVNSLRLPSSVAVFHLWIS